MCTIGTKQKSHWRYDAATWKPTTWRYRKPLLTMTRLVRFTRRFAILIRTS
jgi:hypothetical protein